MRMIFLVLVFLVNSNLILKGEVSAILNEDSFLSLRQREKTDSLTEDMLRTNDLIEAFYLVKNNLELLSIKNHFRELCEFYFGISIDSNFLYTIEEEKKVLESLLESLLNFNLSCSADLKYLFDMKIKCILQEKKKIALKVKTEKLYDLLILSYFTGAFFFQQQKLQISNEPMTNLLEKQIILDEMYGELKREIYDLVLLSDSFLRKEFEQKCFEKMRNNKLFYNVTLLHENILEKIGGGENLGLPLRTRFEGWQDILFKDQEISLFQDFGLWLLDREAVKIDLLRVFNEDFLLFIFEIMRLNQSLEELSDHYYQGITAEERETISLVASFGEFFITKMGELIELKEKINIAHLPPIVISEKRLKKIIKQLSMVINFDQEMNQSIDS